MGLALMVCIVKLSYGFSMLLPNMHRKFRFFLILALLISVFLEITLFNYTHYATLFTSEHFSLAYYKQKFEGNVNYSLNGISENDSLLLPEPQGQLKFTDLNTKIASIYINPIFIQGDKQRVKVIWADEEHSERSINVSIIEGLNFSNYITIAPIGKVSYLNIQFVDNNIAIKQVELNKKIPMVMMPIRMVIVFGISLLLLCLRHTEFREKISYVCFDYLYDKANFRQRIGFAMLICSMLVFNFLASYNSCNGFSDNELNKWFKLYSHHMTDALLKKQLHLDIEVPQALLELERPNDYMYRERHGIFLNYLGKNDGDKNSVLGDYTYYKGKYYSYFGMVPVILLFAPYKLITGNYLPTSMGILLFGSVATVLLMLLWKQIAQNHLKQLPYFFFLIGGATLYASSLISMNLGYSSFHLIPQHSALAFVILGVMALLQAKEKLSIKCLIISSLSFALGVGCRPTALFWSILIPVMLWDKRREMNVSKVLAIIVPFAIVGSILAWYNYARFDSPFSFGHEYMFHGFNSSTSNSIVGSIHSVIREILFTLFYPPNIDLIFPFVMVKKSGLPLADISFIYFPSMIGIFCFPVMWFLLYIRKVSILRNFIFAGIFISLLNMVQLALLNYIDHRYNMDFSWILAIGALICAFQLQEKEIAMRKIVLKSFYSCCGITLLLVFFFVTSRYIRVPQIYHYLARTFGVICNVP